MIMILPVVVVVVLLCVTIVLGVRKRWKDMIIGGLLSVILVLVFFLLLGSLTESIQVARLKAAESRISGLQKQLEIMERAAQDGIETASNQAAQGTARKLAAPGR